MGRNLQWWPESANIKCLSRTCITRCIALANFPQQQESEIVKWQWYVAKTLGANTSNVQTTNRKRHQMRWKVWCHSSQLQLLSPCLLAFDSWRFPTPFKNSFQNGSSGNYGLQRSKISVQSSPSSEFSKWKRPYFHAFHPLPLWNSTTQLWILGLHLYWPRNSAPVNGWSWELCKTRALRRTEILVRKFARA